MGLGGLTGIVKNNSLLVSLSDPQIVGQRQPLCVVVRASRVDLTLGCGHLADSKSCGNVSFFCEISLK